VRTLTCPPTGEVLGVNIIAWVENLQSDETRPIMQKYELLNPVPDKWYPTHLLMDSLNEMAQQANVTSNYVAIGMQVGKICPMPPELTDPDVGQVLSVWDSIYQSLHRSGDVGRICCEKMGDKDYKVTFTDLYPDDFSYGIMYGYAKRFLPQGTHFKVFYDPNVTPRDNGGTGATVIHLTWD